MKNWRTKDERRRKDWQIEIIFVFPQYAWLGEWQSGWMKNKIFFNNLIETKNEKI